MKKDILIITGGTSGLGYEIIKKAIKADLFVCNIGRNIAKMDKLSRLFKENYKGFVGDITDVDFITSTIKEIAVLGNIRYLINNAEKACFKHVTEYKKEDIELSLQGLKGMILCTTEVLKIKEEKNVKIVNIMSSAALRGNKHESLYCAAKWGERGYTESLKTTYKGTSVKIIGVYPGGMNTEFWADSRDYVSVTKAKTFMNPEDVAEVILNNILNDHLTVSDLFIERN